MGDFPVLSLKNISKSFGSVKANDSISIDFHHGSVHAIVGENGAGKSTLMNIFYGLYQPDSGEVLVDSKPYQISSPSDAIALGIGMVHQHFKLVDCFTAAENIVLGEEVLKNPLWLDSKKAEETIKKLSEEYGLHVSPGKKIEDISVGMQQRVEILKCLYRSAKIIILDEPTGVLTPQEIEDLLTIITHLKEKGKTIIFITHKLNEVKAVADRVTVIRHGKVVGHADVHEITKDKIAEMMVGGVFEELTVKRAGDSGTKALDIQGVSYTDPFGVKRLSDLSLSVNKGEILGIAGVDNNGQKELVDIVMGITQADRGSLFFNAVDLKGKNVEDRRAAGISLIPEDRHTQGLVLDFSMKENFVLGLEKSSRFSKYGLLERRNIEKTADSLVAKYDVRPQDINLSARVLSGGNQQKVIIAREVFSDPDLIIAVQPTRGLDIGASKFIREELIKLRDKGRSVLLVSLDLDEVFLLSDRIAVINHGSIAGTRNPEETTKIELGKLMGASC